MLPPHPAPEEGPNLAKGDFLAKYSRSEAKISQEPARHADQNVQNGVLGGRKVHTMCKRRGFERLGDVNSDKSAVKLGQNA